MTVGPFARNLRRKGAVKSLAPYVMVVIMRGDMRKLVPALLLALGACAPVPSSGENRPIAGTAQPLPSAGLTKVNENAVSPANNDSPTNTGKPLNVDATKKFEFADIYVDLTDPNGMRPLVPYLIKPESWMLVQCEMTSSTTKHYKFQRLTTSDGRQIPDVDIFKTRR